MKQTIPTLQETIEHMRLHGGHLKGRGNGQVEWVDEPEPSAEQLLGETPSFSESEDINGS